MTKQAHRRQRGFSLIELLVAMAMGMIIMAAAVQLFRQAVVTTNMVATRAELQQNARAAINVITRDIAVAGNGLPLGGIALPSGAGINNALFACDTGNVCYVTNNTYPNGRLYYVTPGAGKGVNRDDGLATDVVTMAYADPTISFVIAPAGGNNTISANGDNVTLSSITDRGGNAIQLDDAAVGVSAGDAMAITNANGIAVGLVTDVNAATKKITFGPNDALQFNQTGATAGNIKALANAGGGYPGSRIIRLKLITYYLRAENDGTKTLMRQDGAHPPIEVAQGISNITFSYDIFDESTGVATANIADPAGSYNSIRQVNIAMTMRSPQVSAATGQMESMSLVTAVSPRSLSFKDRYK